MRAVFTARQQAEALLPWRTAAPWPNNKINPDPSDPYGDHFSPDRPRLNEYPDDYQYADQPPLPHPDQPDQQYTEMSSWPKSTQHQPLYRGVRVDLDHPQFADHPDVQGMKSILYGDQPQGGMFDVAAPGGNRFPHPDSPEGQKFSDHLLNFMEDTGQRQNSYRTNQPGDNFTKIHDTSDPTWLGRHWTTDPEVAEDFAHPGHAFTPKGSSPRGFSAVIGADWDHRGEDPARSNSGGSWGDEKEINLRPGAQLNVNGLNIRHHADWDDHDWHNVLGAPQTRTARR
jgi:hypothetical protein